MIFNSQEFLFFFIILFFAFWVLPQKAKPGLLLLASYIFYGFTEPALVFLLFSVTAISYFVSKRITKADSEFEHKLLLVIGLIALFLPLLYFKYFNFICQNLNLVSSLNIPVFKIILPVGISFYTFQTAGYLIDVYKTKAKPCDNFWTFALYVSFFPQLVAGPIERASNLIPQLSQEFEYKSNNFKQGLKIAAWGLFKKIVVADQLARFVDPVYNNAANYHGITLLVATVFFAFQIYCDFSGYSDIAIGIARTFDINLMKNFNRPYFALSIFDFWRRWHISLSTWFRDYVYLPLGGNKVNLAQWTFNIVVVFTISGFWHGAEWTFVVWGLVHGLAMLVARLSSPIYNSLEEKLFKPFKLDILVKFLLTFSFVNVTWVFFRANTLPDAFNILEKIFNGSYSYQVLVREISATGLTEDKFGYLLIAIIGLLVLDALQGEGMMPRILNYEGLMMRRVYQYALIFAILFFGYFGKSPFIYFQF